MYLIHRNKQRELNIMEKNLKENIYAYICTHRDMGFPGGTVVKNPPANAGDTRHGFDPWVGKIPWSRKWQPCSSILAWGIPWTEVPGRLQSMGLQSWT